jgi:aspartate beta-hydroxylase
MGMLYDRAMDVLRGVYDRSIVAPPVLDGAAYFPHIHLFLANWQAIRDEAAEIARELGRVPRFHEIMPEQAEISANDERDWRVFVLKAYGIGHARHLEACGSTASLLKQAPEVLSAAFSYMDPNKHIPVHRGPFRGILRFYLVLSMPRLADGQPAAVLKIADREYALSDGQSLLWDDTFPHEVWNRSSAVRTVLLLDVRRFGLPLHLQWLSFTLIALAGFVLRRRGLD